MCQPDPEELEFIRRETLIQGDGSGALTVIPLTLWRDGNGKFVMIPDDADHLPHVERYLAKCKDVER